MSVNLLRFSALILLANAFLLIANTALAKPIFSPAKELSKLPLGESLVTLYQTKDKAPSAVLNKLKTIRDSQQDLTNPFYVFAIKRIEHQTYLKLGQIEKAKNAIHDLQAFGEQHNHDWLIAESKMWQAVFSLQTGKLEDGKTLLSQSLKIAEAVQYKNLAGRIYNAMAVSKAMENKQIEALNLYLKALDVFLNFPGDPYIGKVYGNLAVIYLDIEMWQEVIEFSNKALNFHSENPRAKDIDFAAVHINKGIALGGMGNSEQQYEEYKTALNYAEKSGSIHYKVIVYNNLASYYVQKKQPNEALKHVDKCLPLSKKNGFDASYIGCLRSKAYAYSQLNLLDDALQMGKAGFELVQSITSHNELMYSHKQLADLYQLNKEYEQAYYHLAEYYKIKETNVFSNRNQKIKYLEAQFHDEKEAFQLSLLSTENKLQAEKLEVRSLQQKVAIISMVLCGVIVFLLFFKYKKLIVLFRESKIDYSRLKYSSQHDPLTGLKNRRALEEFLNTISQKNEQYSLVIIDIDHFKRVNDNYGHDYGDLVLKALGGCLKEALRKEDEVFRFGGEEFVVLLNCEEEQDIAVPIARLQQKIRELNLEHGAITISAGVLAPTGAKNIQQQWERGFKLADEALYRAKNNGRNCFQVAAFAPLI